MQEHVVPVHVAAALHAAQVRAVVQHVVAGRAAVARVVVPRVVVLRVAVPPGLVARHVALAQLFVAAWRVLLLQGVLLFVQAQPVGYAQGVPHLIFQHVRRYLALLQPALHLSFLRPGGPLRRLLGGHGLP